MCKKLILFACVVLILGLTGNASAQLLVHYKLDEVSGTVATDTSGKGNDGIIEGTPSWAAGWIDGALQFDGSLSVILPASDMGLYSDTGSIAFWMNMAELTGNINTIWWGGDNTTGGGMGPENEMHIHIEIPVANVWIGGELCFRVLHGPLIHLHSDPEKGDASVPGDPPVNPILVNDGEWHHVVGTWGDADGNVNLYLDGNLLQQAAYTTPSYPLTNIYLGRMADGGRTYTGLLDDVQIYGGALTEDEIQIVMAGSKVLSLAAAMPEPSNQATDVPRDTVLSWLAGDRADKHNVYFGTVLDDVKNAETTNPRSVLVGENQDAITYTPPDLLEFGQTYYWRVDEVNAPPDSTVYKGEVWSFTTANFIVVEDFEDYNDYEPHTIYFTWIDGWDDPANGATSGYPNPIFGIGEHYMETTIVHRGAQSMPVFYNNSAGLSEVTRTLNADWTKDDVLTLTLFYYGDAGNAVEPMYVAVNGSAVVTNDDPKAVLANDWIQWNIPLQEFADQGVNLADVDTLSIGMGNKAAPQAGGGTGHVFFDDIRLYRSLPEEPEPGPEPVDPGTDNLVAYYAFENNTEDDSGNGYDATASGNPQYVSGPTGYGMAVEFDGTGDYVRLPIGSAIAGMNDITVSTWANFSGLGGAWQRLWDFGNNDQVYMFVTPRMGTAGALRFAIIAAGVAETNITASETLPSGWHHVAATIDSASMTMKLYQDGKLVAEGPTTLLPSDLGETTENYLGRSQFAADSYYFGSLDEFRIYNRALSEGEVLYLAGK